MGFMRPPLLKYPKNYSQVNWSPLKSLDSSIAGFVMQLMTLDMCTHTITIRCYYLHQGLVRKHQIQISIRFDINKLPRNIQRS